MRHGELVVFPTDTVFGIGASLADPEAIRQLYAAKQRSHEKPTAVLISDLEQVRSLVDWEQYGPVVIKLAQLWPGALTIILPFDTDSPYRAGLHLIGGAEHKVGLRLPDHPLTLELISRLGHPLVASSANVSGGPASVTYAEVSPEIRQSASIILEGDTRSGIASTVVDLSSDPPQILRQGGISEAQIKEACS